MIFIPRDNRIKPKIRMSLIFVLKFRNVKAGAVVKSSFLTFLKKAFERDSN